MRAAESFENLLLSEEVKKFSVSYGTPIFITEFTRATIFPYPDIDKLIQPFPSYFKDEFKIILPSMPGFYKYSLSFRPSHQNPPLPHTGYVPLNSSSLI
jgi:hypothetical protein